MDNLKLISTFKAHVDKAWTVSWNHQGTLLASCGSDKVIHIWKKEGENYRCQFTLEGSHTRTVRSVAWSSCDLHLASTGFDAITSLWSRDDVAGVFDAKATLEGHENEVKSVDWSASGQYIATCSRDKSVWIWEVDHLGDYECCEVLTDHAQDVKCVKWNPCEDTLASCSYDNTIKMYSFDQEDWSCHDTLVSHTSTVWCLSFNEKGDQLASCSDDKTVKVWQRYLPDNDQGVPVTSVAKWKCFCTIDGYHERAIYSISWDWTSGLLATACGDDFVRIFRVAENSTPGEPVTYDLYARSPANQLGHDCNCVSWRSGRRPARSPPTTETEGHTGKENKVEGHNGQGRTGEIDATFTASTDDLDDPHNRQLTSCDDNGEISMWTVTVE